MVCLLQVQVWGEGGWIKSSIIRNSRRRLRRSSFDQSHSNTRIVTRSWKSEFGSSWSGQFRIVWWRRTCRNARSRAYSRSSRLHVQNVREVKTWTAAEVFENEPFMYNKLVAGREAKVAIWTDLNLWTLSSGFDDVRCIIVQAKSVEIHVNVHFTEGVCLWKHVQCWSHVHTHAEQLQQLHQSQQLQQPEGWRFVLDTILPQYQWAPQWVPVRTPTVHWGPISGKAVGGPLTV